MQFCANVSILFKEVPFLERFERAAAAGFAAVEFWWPAGEALDEVEAAIREAGVAVALFNFDAGEMAAGHRGLLRTASGRTCPSRSTSRSGSAASA
jgi:hydroxypyruvate isomerase